MLHKDYFKARHLFTYIYHTRGTPKVLQLDITNQFLWINIFSTRKLYWFKLSVQIWVQFTWRFTQYGYLNQTGWLLELIADMELNREQNRLLIWYCFKRRLTPSAAFDELRTSLEEQAPSFAHGSIPYQQLTLTVNLSDLNSHTEWTAEWTELRFAPTA